MNTELTIDDIPRLRILCVGRGGVGKSSLINRVLGIQAANVSEYAPGEATIDREFLCRDKSFVLHDSNGFEPGSNTNFELAARFLRGRHDKKLLKDRLHAIWLCAEMPRAGGRVLEEGDRKLLALAHELKLPVVVVFTKCDLLLWSKQLEEAEEGTDGMDKGTLCERSVTNAINAFKASVCSLDKSATMLRIPAPHYMSISVLRGYEESISNLAEMTRRLVRERLKGDGWVTRAIAQRVNLPMRIEGCVGKEIRYCRFVCY